VIEVLGLISFRMIGLMLSVVGVLAATIWGDVTLRGSRSVLFVSVTLVVVIVIPSVLSAVASESPQTAARERALIWIDIASVVGGVGGMLYLWVQAGVTVGPPIALCVVASCIAVFGIANVRSGSSR
jgi:hypothetical protein